MADADGDVVRCRWAESAQGECGGVCQAFPAKLDQVRILKVNIIILISTNATASAHIIFFHRDLIIKLTRFYIFFSVLFSTYNHA